MTISDVFLLGASGIAMGIVAVTAGGGATIGVPLVLLFGYPANVSIVAVKFGLVGSFLTGTFAYRGLRAPKITLPFHIWPLSMAGAVLGANLVLNLDPNLLRLLVLVLLVVTLIFSVALKPSEEKEHAGVSRSKRILGSVTIFFLCIYSGFFGAGFGSFLIFSLMYFYGYSYLESASASTAFALLITGSSVATFLFKGAVNFSLAIPIIAGCSIGGFIGAKVARHNGDRFIRVAFITLTILLTLKLGYESISRLLPLH